MSRRERDRMTIMVEIKRKELTLVEASQVMDLSYRQTRRVWRRYQTDGDAGLVHRLRGQPSLRRKAPELRQRVLARYDERYWDFGPTLAAEYLESRRAESRSRDAAAVVDHRRQTQRATAASASPAMARTAKPALARWSNWTGRTTTGSRAGGPSAC
jgi:Helix-turn-helix domain